MVAQLLQDAHGRVDLFEFGRSLLAEASLQLCQPFPCQFQLLDRILELGRCRGRPEAQKLAGKVLVDVHQSVDFCIATLVRVVRHGLLHARDDVLCERVRHTPMEPRPVIAATCPNVVVGFQPIFGRHKLAKAFDFLLVESYDDRLVSARCCVAPLRRLLARLLLERRHELVVRDLLAFGCGAVCEHSLPGMAGGLKVEAKRLARVLSEILDHGEG